MKIISILVVAFMLDSCGDSILTSDTPRGAEKTDSESIISGSIPKNDNLNSSEFEQINDANQSSQSNDQKQTQQPPDAGTDSPASPSDQKTPPSLPQSPQSPPTTAPEPVNANTKLFNYYISKSNYDQVFSEVLTFYPAGRSNGCVAFLSSALRQSGTPVPKDLWINGYNVSLVTIALSNYLKSINWRRIDSPNELIPGDIVMTLPPKEYPGIPAHTYMFHSWKDYKKGIGLVIDNQDFTHERNIFGSGTYNFTPFWYALREK